MFWKTFSCAEGTSVASADSQENDNKEFLGEKAQDQRLPVEKRPPRDRQKKSRVGIRDNERIL